LKNDNISIIVSLFRSKFHHLLHADGVCSLPAGPDSTTVAAS
jgi:hypothetical protein